MGLHITSFDSDSKQRLGCIQRLNAETLVLPASSDEFFQQLGSPTLVRVAGKTRQNRVVITLLHRNNTSAIYALYRLLKEQFIPYANTTFFIAATAAELRASVLCYRSLAKTNTPARGVTERSDDFQSVFTRPLFDHLVNLAPEAIVEIHNSPCAGPPLCISQRNTPQHQALASHFCSWFLYSPTVLDPTIDAPVNCPFVTIETGATFDESTHTRTYHGLTSYLSAKTVFTDQQPVEVISQPKTLQVNNNASIAFADKPVFGANITICQDIEKRNALLTYPGDIIGWVDHHKLAHFRMKGGNHCQSIEQFFSTDDHQLTVVKPVRFFMATSNSKAAKNHGLLYFA